MASLKIQNVYIKFEKPYLGMSDSFIFNCWYLDIKSTLESILTPLNWWNKSSIVNIDSPFFFRIKSTSAFPGEVLGVMKL